MKKQLWYYGLVPVPCLSSLSRDNVLGPLRYPRPCQLRDRGDCITGPLDRGWPILHERERWYYSRLATDIPALAVVSTLLFPLSKQYAVGMPGNAPILSLVRVSTSGIRSPSRLHSLPVNTAPRWNLGPAPSFPFGILRNVIVETTGEAMLEFGWWMSRDARMTTATARLQPAW